MAKAPDPQDLRRDVWHYEDHGEAGHSGFFLDREKRAGIQFLIWGPGIHAGTSVAS